MRGRILAETIPLRGSGGERLTLTASDHDLTVIVPAYNEANRLPRTLTALAEFCGRWGLDYRVLVADDGSQDGTARVATRFGRRFATLQLTENRGKGHAVRQAMLKATGRVLAFTDADLPYDLSALRQGYEWIDKGACEVAFGARDVTGSRHLAPRKVSRQLATLSFRLLVRTCISREVTDTQCGLKLFERGAAYELFSRATVDGFAFDAELVRLTHLLRLSYRRLPVTLINEYDSRLSLVRHTLPMAADVLRLWWRHHGDAALERRFRAADVALAPPSAVPRRFAA